MHYRIPLGWFSVSTLLALMTVVVSLVVAYLANESALAPVSMIDLRRYGGTTFEDLAHLELWRIITAQLIHAKMPHMLLNALGLLLLGKVIEQAIGSLKVFLVWLLGGGMATVISPVFIDAPWNVGTGASQATFAFAGCAAVLAVRGTIKPTVSWSLIAAVLVPGFTLDLVSGGYPKPGHVAGLLIGAFMGLSIGVSTNDDR